MIRVTAARHAYPERAGFTINRKTGHPQYTFLHFFESVEILVKGKIIQTEPHASILYPPGEPQYFHAQQNLTHDWIHFTATAEDLASLGIKETTLYYQRSEWITELTREIEREQNANEYGAAILAELKLKELFLRIFRDSLGRSIFPLNQNTEDALRALRSNVFTHLNERWTVKKMAQEICLSESRFYFLYHSLFGISPVEDLICARMDVAKHALSFSDERVSEIAEQLGYQNVSHFLRQFKIRVGETPTSYRKNRRF